MHDRWVARVMMSLTGAAKGYDGVVAKSAVRARIVPRFTVLSEQQ